MEVDGTMADNGDDLPEDGDEEAEKAIRTEEERRRENEDRKQRRQTRSDQRAIFELVHQNSGDAENINSNFRQELKEKVNTTFKKITHTREQLNDALLFKEQSILLKNVAAKMDDASR